MPKQILLADDSVTIQKVVQITFAHEDYAITSVKSTDEAIARARELRPDVVLADAGLVGKSGYDLCAALRGDPQLSSTPCLILTGNFSPYDEAKGTRVGADGYIVKPFETQAMIDKVTDLITKKVSRSAQPTIPEGMVAPSVQKPTPPPAARPTPTAPPRPMTIEPLAKPLSMVAADRVAADRVAADSAAAPMAKASTVDSDEFSEMPTASRGGAMPISPVRPASTLMGMPAAAPPMPNLPASRSQGIPVAAPQMPRPPMIPHVPTPQVGAKSAASLPRPTLMGIPAMTPAAAGRGAVTLPPSPPSTPAARGASPPPWAQPARDEPSRPPEAPRATPAALSGPERDAIEKLSREVIERIVWEVVPELAETIIREQLDRLVKERQ